MRFVVHEQAYEKPIASGQLRYEHDGRATGTVESWRLNAATEGYEILRVDLDERETESGHSYLYHLVRQADGRPERLSFRFWGNDLLVEGNVLFAETAVTSTRTVNDQTSTEEAELTPGYGFWFPSSIGLGLLVGFAGGTAVTLNAVNSNQLSVFGLQVVEVDVVAAESRALTIRWLEQERTIWLDEHNWLVKMVCGGLSEGSSLTAVETHPIWHK